MNTFAPGLAGVVAAQTRLSSVDGEAGELLIAGYPVETLAPQASFEEVVYLLWHDRLPSGAELRAFGAEMAARREVPPLAYEALRSAAAERITAMDTLRMAAGTLPVRDEGGLTAELTLLAQLPTLVAAGWRLAQGNEPLAPRADLGHAANYLYMLLGELPDLERVRGLETYLNTVVDHGLNASTFTARVIVSTGSDLVSAVAGALGALKGPLHGGAPGPALDMVFEIREIGRAEAVLRAKLDRHERLMGFGHRVYRVRDPRADVLAEAAQRFYERAGDLALYDLARGVEAVALRLLAEYQPDRRLQTNVEYYTALLLHGLGLPVELFTPTFAISRAAGWIAHCIEQQEQNRIIRPQSEYIGERNRQWVPLDER
ncbi:MAG: citrate synthase/methylcitrate synthase [Anaerolineales bacterium]